MHCNPAGSNEYIKLELQRAWEPQIVNALQKMIKREDLKIVFLIKTKSDEDWVLHVRDQCGFKNGIAVPSEGKSGGLALFWNCESLVHVQKYSLGYVDALLDGGSTVGWWHFTRFYGDSETSKRDESWWLLKFL